MAMKLGCDPEVFLTDAAGALISSIGKIGGTKENPRELPIGKGYCVQEDNVALEFNIPPAESKQQFKDHIGNITKYLKNYINYSGMKFSESSAELFPLEQLQNPAALVFGCDPDFNAWLNGRVNPRPQADDHRLRSCGGHIHIGVGKQTRRQAIRLIQFMDLYAGIPSVLMDKGELRKKLYGKAGAYRQKPYGVEYRVLSNFWIFKDQYIDWAWDATERAVNAWQDNNNTTLDEVGNLVRGCIDFNDKDMAAELVKKYDLPVVYA